jgi:hypothetical protein
MKRLWPSGGLLLQRKKIITRLPVILAIRKKDLNTRIRRHLQERDLNIAFWKGALDFGLDEVK